MLRFCPNVSDGLARDGHVVHVLLRLSRLGIVLIYCSSHTLLRIIAYIISIFQSLWTTCALSRGHTAGLLSLSHLLYLLPLTVGTEGWLEIS